MSNKSIAPLILAGAATVFFATIPVKAAGQTEVGRLNCSAAGGFEFGATKNISCTFVHKGGKVEKYAGKISKFSADHGFTKKSRIIWGVVASGALKPGALAGNYAGNSALKGGAGKAFALKPVNGKKGANGATGIAGLQLKLKN
ncbi:MAG: DUF992 domain-containing protein [Hyphomicrobiales bacterium]